MKEDVSKNKVKRMSKVEMTEALRKRRGQYSLGGTLIKLLILLGRKINTEEMTEELTSQSQVIIEISNIKFSHIIRWQ